jgi:2-keto-3-deoxy-6-phosphogluconate aldolase
MPSKTQVQHFVKKWRLSVIHLENAMEHMDTRLLGILRTRPDTRVENAVKAIEIAIESGVKAVEITSNSDHFQQVVQECSKKKIHIGVGSIKTGISAKEAIECGAKFLVSPGIFEDAIAVANEFKIPLIPGVFDLNEVATASELGIKDIKFFPAFASSHAELLKAIKEPFREECDELTKLGWQITTVDELEPKRKFIKISTPTQFYKAYLKAKNERPSAPLAIKFPPGKKGFPRLKNVSEIFSTTKLRFYAVGGVGSGNMNDVLTKYGAYGACIGKGMFDPDAIYNQDFEKVRSDVVQYVAIVKEFEEAWNTYVS